MCNPLCNSSRNPPRIVEDPETWTAPCTLQHPASRGAVSAAAACYAANAALGTAVLLGLVDTSRVRWVHHLLYIGTCLATAAALLAAAADPHGRRTCAALAPAVLPLAVIPFAGTHGRRHPAVALAAAPFYAAALLRAWR